MIYMDNAATTAVIPEALDKMLPYFTESYGNPSALYSFAQRSKNAVDNARDIIAATLSASLSEIYFTGGGSESDNWALKAVAEKYRDKGTHIITTAIEHHAILHTASYLEKQGFTVTYLPVDSEGRVSVEDVKKAVRPDTILISVMSANNEVGTIQPVQEIGALARERGILFHTDAVQAYGHLPIDVQKLNIDLLSASGHKFGGPKGVGFMYVRGPVKIGSFIHGGAQERGRRAGTINVPGIVGMGEAARIACDNIPLSMKKTAELSGYMTKRILTEIPDAILNGAKLRTDAETDGFADISRLPNNINISLKDVEGETLLILLDQDGICASSGSACTSGSLSPSHVLKAMGVSDDMAHSALRLSISDKTTTGEADYVIERLKKHVAKLRSMR